MIMARNRVKFTNELMKRWIREGRGQGEGYDYKPWIRVQNFASLGVVHRIKGTTHGRVHHLFSNLERDAFLQHQWPVHVKDVREQFPLQPIDETIEIAREMGIRHPTDPRTKCPIVMTTDLFLTVQQGTSITWVPIAVKYLSELTNTRATEKLELARRYWAAQPRNLKMETFTEKDVSEDFVRNMLWVYPYYWTDALYPLTEEEVERISSSLTRLILNEQLSLRDISKKCDGLLHLETGTSLAVVRHLLANRYWEVDMNCRLKTSEQLTLLNSPESVQYRKRS